MVSHHPKEERNAHNVGPIQLVSIGHATPIQHKHEHHSKYGGEAKRVDSGDNTADMHTKPLPKIVFTKLRKEMGVFAICNGKM